MDEKYNVITFETTHYSIAADNCLVENNILHKLIPIPQEISAGCGFCLRVEPDDFERIKKKLMDRNIQMSGFYYMEKKGFKSTITCLKD